MSAATGKRAPAQVAGVRPRARLSDACSRSIVGRYDAAQTTTENTRHWASADSLSARAAHSPEVRRVLRVRSRYEIANCPLARGILKKLADFVVGTGPRLVIKTRDREYNRAVERAFGRWMVATGFARKLWQMRYAKALNGEAFAMFFTNPPRRTESMPVTLDLRTIEADQVADPALVAGRQDGSDGIVFDDFGNPMAYRVLRNHPGDTFAAATLPSEYDTVAAANMIHYFDAERPGQVRGVPEITAALPLFAMRRRYILAVLAAAETAADLAGVIETQSAPENPDELEPLDAVEIERRMLMTLPMGWKLSQLRAEQPTTTIEMFDTVIVREIARCVNMPYGIAASDSSNYNFASGKLDHLPWFQTVRIEQDHIEDVCVDPTFERWYDEASRIPGYLPPSPVGERVMPPHQWFWDGQDLLDPRESGAKATGLQFGFETHGRIAARRGEDVLDEWEAEAELYGIQLDEYRQLVLNSVFGGGSGAGGGADSSGGTDDEDA